MLFAFTLGSAAIFLAGSPASVSGHVAPVPTWAPIPHEALGPPLNSDGYRVEDLSGGAYMVTDNSYNALFVVSNHGVIVADAPPTIGRNMLHAIRNTTKAPITHVIYSHSHADHIGGAYLYGDHVSRIAHRLTKENLEQTPDPHRPLPDQVFDETLDLCVGNQTLQLKYDGNNHQPGNIYIYAPKQKVLMLVDVVFPGWANYAYLGEAQWVPGIFRAYETIESYDFRHFIGGHVQRSGTRKDILMSKEYLTDLKTNCLKAIELSALPANSTNNVSAQALAGPVSKANPGNNWAVFKYIFDAATDYCNEETKKKWLGKIGAADVYGYENAYAVSESLRIDYGMLGPFGVK